MTEVLLARQEGREYPVHVGDGAARALAGVAADRDVAVISCARVLATPFARRLLPALRRAARVRLVHALPDRERGKTLAQLERAASRMLEAGATRRTLVVAVGGGAVTDAAGLLAATFMRGVDWAAVPTTLLGMVDAALGGKTAVNLPRAKNAVGAFHPPVVVLSDTAALRTLTKRELRSGFGEVLKYAALRPTLLDEARARAAAGEPDGGLIAACARIKLEIVEADPKEKGARKLLNLGHTFGHGVEAAGGFARYAHGEAVAVGLVFAFRLAERMRLLDARAAGTVEEAVRAAGLPTRVPAAVARRAARLLRYDKKRTGGALGWVLPRAVGAAWEVGWDVHPPPEAVAATVREIGRTR